jgi:hypothetical protein
MRMNVFFLKVYEVAIIDFLAAGGEGGDKFELP